MLKHALVLLLALLSACGYGLSASQTAGPRNEYVCHSPRHPDEAWCYRDWGRPKYCHIHRGYWVCQ